MVKNNNYTRRGGYIRRFEYMLASPAYRSLSTNARCLLEEFQRIYRPDRNGHLSISTKNAAKLLNISEPSASNAFYELAACGFIKLKNYALWQERKAREFSLTFEPMNNREPTDEWKEFTPGKPYPVPGRKKSRPKKQGQNC